MKKMGTITALVTMTIFAFASWAAAADLPDVALPAPRMDGGKPLMQALRDRQSTRAFSPEALPVQVVADLLWAAFGINRPDSGKRTAPSARNWQEIEIYAVMEDGAYLYDAGADTLRGVAKGDLRRLTGTQNYVAAAPLNLVYVADTTKMKGATADNQQLYAGAAAGFISQNVYLFCASEGLATVVRASINRDVLAKALNLPEYKKIILSQSLGYPEN